MVARRRLDVGAADISPALSGPDAYVPRGWDDFVPVGEYCPLDYGECSESHDFERDIQRRLLETPGLHFSSLIVRRIDDGICVQGILEISGPHIDIGKVVRDISGVENVVNQVLVRQTQEPAIVI